MSAKPFLKWAGGKRQLLPEILKRVPQFTGTYYEPFVGGGSVLFGLGELVKGRAFISDSNDRLMMAYMGVQRDVNRVIEILKTFEDTLECYRKNRDALNHIDLDDVENAARIAALMIYINKCGFNGLYRENSSGLVNTPYGWSAKFHKKPVVFCDEARLRAASQALDTVALESTDFRDIMEHYVQSGDFVYVDPPYIPVSDKSFTKYTKSDFGAIDQRELAEACRSLDSKGVKFLVSNSDTLFTHELYAGFKIETVQARRAINSKGGGRGPVNELLISNF